MQFNLVTHWDSYLSRHQKYQNLILDGFCDIRTLIDDCYSDAILDCAWIQAILG